jgi:hypothetical protein
LAWIFLTQSARRPRSATSQKVSPLQDVAHWRTPRLSRTPSGRLQQGVARRRDAQLPFEHHGRVDHPHLQRVDDTILGG